MSIQTQNLLNSSIFVLHFLFIMSTSANTTIGIVSKLLCNKWQLSISINKSCMVSLCNQRRDILHLLWLRIIQVFPILRKYHRCPKMKNIYQLFEKRKKLELHLIRFGYKIVCKTELHTMKYTFVTHRTSNNILLSRLLAYWLRPFHKHI